MTRSEIELAELVVVPRERHVERLARAGVRGETRASLRARLAAGLLPHVRFADATEVRLTLAIALEEVVSRGQLELFAGGGADPLLAPLRARGGAAWVRAASALDEAIGLLRARGATAEHLERVRGDGVAPRRARTLAAATKALDEALARSGARDGRLACAELAGAIRGAGPEAVRAVVGAARVRARWILAWDPADLAWWRALDETLASVAGNARVVLPAFDQRLEGARERNPLEVIADVVARHLDAAPETEAITPVLGDLGSTTPSAAEASRVRLLRAADARAQATAAARVLREALDGGASVERVAIACASRDERTLLPLRHALEAERVVFHEPFGAPPSSVPVVAAALQALAAAESLDRVDVARVLRSGYVDAPRLLVAAGEERLDFRDAERVLARIARALETRATAAGPDEVERLVATAAGRTRDDEGAARRAIGVLARARTAITRAERVVAARTLFQELGLAARAGRGALGTFARDEAPTGIDRAERAALARDVRAWEVLEAALDAAASAALRTGAGDRPLEAEVFRLELTELLDRPAPRPGAAGAGAVRVATLAEIAGDELDLLVVLDANDGLLPREAPPVTLVSEALETSLARASRGAFSAPERGEIAARDLAALATAAAEASAVVLCTTASHGGEAGAPSRVFLALERAGVAVEDGAASPGALPNACILRSSVEIARRARRERAREGFFLDPARVQSDVVGNLALGGGRDDVARALVAATGASAERALAVTSLERFAQCPFRGYASVVLGAREPEEQQELPDAREEGNLGHSALAAAFVATREEWLRRPRSAGSILERGIAAADASMDQSAAHAPLRAIVRLRARESVRAMIARAIDEDEWDFAFAEHAFGTGKPWPPLRIADEHVEVWLRGTIDRVDRGHVRAAARVVDYKRSKSTVRSSGAHLGETALQVPIYALVASRRLEVPAVGAYVPMQPRDFAELRGALTKIEATVGELVRGEGGGAPIERRVLEVISGARAGRFAPLPARDAECTRCGMSGACRRPRFAMAPDDELDDKEPA